MRNASCTRKAPLQQKGHPATTKVHHTRSNDALDSGAGGRSTIEIFMVCTAFRWCNTNPRVRLDLLAKAHLCQNVLRLEDAQCNPTSVMWRCYRCASATCDYLRRPTLVPVCQMSHLMTPLTAPLGVARPPLPRPPPPGRLPTVEIDQESFPAMPLLTQGTH